MTLKELKIQFHSTIKSLYESKEIDSFYYLIIEHFLKLKRIDLALNPNQTISDENINIINTALKKLKHETPIQYIIGETEFYGLQFKVNEHVLIPRPETEELVSWIIQSLSNPENNQHQIPIPMTIVTKILDIGTGSGCIPISLAKNIPNSIVYAIDISDKAIEVAKENADLNNVNINFIEQDILKTPSLQGVIENNLKPPSIEGKFKFDIIVSNPPYVRELEKQEITNNVLNNEPHLALFVKDNNPLIFYDQITGLAKESLTDKGLLFFEINQYLGKETVELLKQKGFSNIELRKDIFGNDRMIKASID